MPLQGALTHETLTDYNGFKVRVVITEDLNFATWETGGYELFYFDWCHEDSLYKN